jgi:hypothetical protein
VPSTARFGQIAQVQAGRIGRWRALELLKTDETRKHFANAGIERRF